MSSGMVVDLEALERFINTLRKFDDDLADSVSKLSTHFRQLGDVWRDSQYTEFAKEWEEALTAIQTYLDDSPDQIKFLRRKADVVNDYFR